MSSKEEAIALPEPPTGSYLQSEIITFTKTDFHKNTWTLKYRSWTVSTRGTTQDYLAYCFYTPKGEAKLAQTVPLDPDDVSYQEMFKYFGWFVFSYDSKIIEVDIQEPEKEKPVQPEIKKLTGRRTTKLAV
jgi:hypothetical protein